MMIHPSLYAKWRHPASMLLVNPYAPEGAWVEVEDCHAAQYMCTEFPKTLDEFVRDWGIRLGVRGITVSRAKSRVDVVASDGTEFCVQWDSRLPGGVPERIIIRNIIGSINRHNSKALKWRKP